MRKKTGVLFCECMNASKTANPLLIPLSGTSAVRDLSFYVGADKDVGHLENDAVD
jgi:hypothetical protein